MQQMVSIGIPLKTVLRRQGWSESEIQQLEADKQEEEKARATIASTALQLARLELETNNQPYNE
jgi:hypothetical protein